MAWLESVWRTDTLTGSGWPSFLLLSCSVILLLIFIFKRRLKVWHVNQIPGPKTVPFLGNSFDVNINPSDLFSLICGKFCSYDTSLSRVWSVFSAYILLYKAQSAEVILSSQKHIYKSRDYGFLHPWLGTGLLTATGRKWHNRRKMLTPTFHFKILEDFVEVFNQQSFTLVQNLKKKADGRAFDISQFITLCALDIILETAMGRTINAQGNSECEYVKAVHRIGSIIQKRQLLPWFRPNILFRLFGDAKEHDRCLKILHGFSYGTIRERRKEYKELQEVKTSDKSADEMELIGKRSIRLAFLDLLLEYSEHSSLSDEDIREEVDTFMFEGHDTTAAAFNWAVYLLGSYPGIQQEVHNELDSIFGNTDRYVTQADLREMKLLDCCIKETLRLFPSVPFIARELQEDVFIDGYKVPSGNTAVVITYKLHRDPDQFPDPEEFKPERFLPENCMKRHPYAYVPFSAGPRNCIGQKFAQMEMKICLSNFFRKYRVETVIKREDLKLLGELVIRSLDGNIVKLFPR